MKLLRYVMDDFYLEAIVDTENQRLHSIVGCNAVVEVLELDYVMVTTAKTNMTFKLKEEIHWLSSNDYELETIAELIEDYDAYVKVCLGDGLDTDPAQYIREFEDDVGVLPKPLKQYFLKMTAGGTY